MPLSPPICHKTCRPEFPALEEIKSPKYGPSEFGFADLEDAGEIPMMLPLRGDAPCHQESNSGARSVGGKLDVREGLGGPLQRTVLPGRRSVALAVQSFDSANGNATRGLPAGVNRGVKRPVGRAWPTGLFALEKAAVQSLEEDGGHDGVRSGGDTAQGAAQSSEQAHGGKVQSAGAFSGAPSGLKMGRRERGGSVGLEHQSGQSQGDGHIGDVDERNEGIEGGERKAASSAHGVTTFTIVTGGDHTVLGSNAPAQEKQGEVFNYLRAVQKRAAAGRAGPQGTGEGGQKWEADEGGAGMQKAPPVRAVKRAALVSSSLGVLRDASIEPGEARLEIRSPGQRSGEAGADTEVTRKVSAEQEKQRSDPGWVCLKLEPTELGTRGDGTGTLLRTAAIAEAAATLAKRNGPSDLLTPSDSVDVAETCMFSVADTASAYREPKGVRPLSELGDVFEEGGDLAEAANGERKSSVKRRAPLVSWPQFGSPVKRPKEAKLKPKPGVVSYVQPERKTLAAGAIEGVIPKGVNVSELTAAVVERARAASVAEIGAKVRETEAEAQFWDLPSPVRPLPQRGAANGGPAERSTVALDGAEAGKGAAERGAADVSKKRRFAGPEELDPAEVERPETGTKVGPVGNGKLIETGAVAPEKNSVSEWLVGRIPARRETRRKKPVDGTSGSGAKESAGGAFSKIGSPVAASNGALESAAGVEQGDGARNGDNQGLSDLEESERYNRTSARVRMLRELLADRQKDRQAFPPFEPHDCIISQALSEGLTSGPAS